MAVVKMHQIRSTISKAIDYVENAAKTDGRSLVGSTLGVRDARQLALEFDAVQREAEARKSDPRGRKGEIKAWHVIQSFAPGETNGAEAFALGQEFAQRITGGKHDFIIATHVDKAHVHNHILINPVDLDTWKRMHVGPRTIYKYRRISDQLCRARGLSVIENPGRGPVRPRPISTIYAGLGGGSEKRWLAGIIDEAVIRASDWKGFTSLLKEYGITTRMRGTQVVFDLPREGSRAVRGASLGAPYMTEELLARIACAPSPTFLAAPSLVSEADEHGMRMVRLPGARADFGQDVYLALSERQMIDAGKMHVGIVPPGTRLDLFGKDGQFVASVPSATVFRYFARKERRAHIPRPAMAPRGQTKAQQRRNAAIDRKWDTLKLRHAPQARQLRESYALLSEAGRPAFARDLSARIDAGFARLDALIVEREQAVRDSQGKHLGPSMRLKLSRLDRNIAAAEFDVRSLARAWEDTVGADARLATRLDTGASGVRFDSETRTVASLESVYVGTDRGKTVAAKYEGTTDLSREAAWEIRTAQYMTRSTELEGRLGVGYSDAMDALVAVQERAPAHKQTKAYKVRTAAKAAAQPSRATGRAAPALAQPGGARNRQQQQEGPAR